MGELPAAHRERIQDAALRYRKLELEQSRHLIREVLAKLAIVIGPLITLGSFFTNDIGWLGAISGIIAAGLGVQYQLETRVTEPRRLDEQRLIAESLKRLGVTLSGNGRKAAALHRDGTRSGYVDPFDSRSYH
ncbi:MAG: hypothetical protein ACXWVS_08930 [Hyphomicrobium sp.]